jgi:hypothetical protein
MMKNDKTNQNKTVKSLKVSDEAWKAAKMQGLQNILRVMFIEMRITAKSIIV